MNSDKKKEETNDNEDKGKTKKTDENEKEEDKKSENGEKEEGDEAEKKKNEGKPAEPKRSDDIDEKPNLEEGARKIKIVYEPDGPDNGKLTKYLVLMIIISPIILILAAIAYYFSRKRKNSKASLETASISTVRLQFEQQAPSPTFPPKHLNGPSLYPQLKPYGQ